MKINHGVKGLLAVLVLLSFVLAACTPTGQAQVPVTGGPLQSVGEGEGEVSPPAAKGFEQRQWSSWRI